MKMIAGQINGQMLQNLLSQNIHECSEVRVAVAYASYDCIDLFNACETHAKPLVFFGRYDETVPVAPSVIKWFLDRKANPELRCCMVSDFYHPKVIWWVGQGAYIGSANLTSRAWSQNVEVGVFIPDEELESQGLAAELELIFDEIDARSDPIDEGFYKHLLELVAIGKDAYNAGEKLKASFEDKRYFAKGKGLATGARRSASARRLEKFQRNWQQTLQLLREIALRVSRPENKPAWIPSTVPSGAQADQFLHAYYYHFVKGGRGSSFLASAHAKNKGSLTRALDEAVDWWKRDYVDYSNEQNMLLKWAPRLKELLSKDRLLNLNKDEFCEALSMVHAVRDYASKRGNLSLDLPDSPQNLEVKIRRHAEQLWDKRAADGRTPLQVMHNVFWGNGKLENRIWEAATDPKVQLPWVKFSTLGEMAGWARPDEYPPRNDRTVKGLIALGHSVREF
jgi:hypothetical protein